MFKESEDILKEALGTVSGEESVEEATVLNNIAVTYRRMEQLQMSRFANNHASCCCNNHTIIGSSINLTLNCQFTIADNLWCWS